MTKITTYNRGIIIDGHADTKEECETITLLCNSLAKDKNFKQVAYDDGYAAFKRVGHTEELKFWSGENIYVNGNAVNIRVGGENTFAYCASVNTTVYTVTDTNVVWNDGTILQHNSVDVLPTDTIIFTTDAYTTRASAVKKSVDLTTLSGWSNLAPGNHTIKIVAKGTGYIDSEKSAGVEVTKPAPVYTDCLTFTGETSEFTLKATNKEWDGTLQWSTDHNTWTTLTGTEEMQSVGKKLYLRGKGNTKFCQSGNYKGVRWQLSAKAGCSGNIQTLLDYENPPTSIPADYCYRNMFYDCTNLTSAPELPATTLTKYCYYNMFSSCTNLTTTPKLPATALASYCYEYMFTYCSNLITAPELLATTLKPYCYAFMFEGCTKLKVNTSSGNKIFTCPSDIPIMAVNNMFGSTGGSFTGEPTSGNTYYWTE